MRDARTDKSGGKGRRFWAEFRGSGLGLLTSDDSLFFSFTEKQTHQDKLFVLVNNTDNQGQSVSTHYILVIISSVNEIAPSHACLALADPAGGPFTCSLKQGKGLTPGQRSEGRTCGLVCPTQFGRCHCS